jgi:hypothetical protein
MNNIKEIQDVLEIKFIINVNVIAWNKIIKFDFKGDFKVIRIRDKIIFNIIIILIIIQYIF